MHTAHSKKCTSTMALTASAALLSLALLTGCQANSSETGADAETSDTPATAPAEYTFTDDAGASVTVSNPQRVVACMGSFANIWELAGGTLVGASDDAFASYDLTSENVAKIGDFSNINLESLIALDPDFVIMTSGSGGRGGDSSQLDHKAALEASGIPVAYFEVSTLDDYLRMLRICCDITGRDDLYAENGEAVAGAIDRIVQDVPEGSAPSVLLMTTFSGGVRVQNSGTMTGTMLAALGAKNIADENPSLLKDLNMESVIERNPDYIFIVPMGNNAEAAQAALKKLTDENPAWATLSAVEQGRCIMLDAPHFLYKPNSNWDESYQILFDALYATDAAE